MIPRLLSAAFEGKVPTRVTALTAGVEAAELADFKLCPILATDDAPVRLSVSDRAQRDWPDRVGGLWPPLATFAHRRAPRRMIDTDGRWAACFADELQLEGGTLMCRVRDTNGVTATYELVPAPHDGLPEPLQKPVARALSVDSGGKWAVRLEHGRICAALWITEARWRGDLQAPARVMEALGVPRLWNPCAAVLEEHGWTAYPDTLEFRTGGIDVTMAAVPTDASVNK